jgi:tRNA threonylcarbamoyladenosine biosynthesis protein TsaB
MIAMATHQSRRDETFEQIWIAAIDTSSDQAGVALFDGGRPAVIAWNAHRNHTVDTLAQLDHLLRLTGISLPQLRGVAVATGPGSFSALRVGLSVAKGLAFSLNIPLMGISTTEAIAANFAWTERPVLAVMTAGRGRVVWTRFESGTPPHGPHNTSVDELRIAAAEGPGSFVAGDTELLVDIESMSLPAGARVEQIARLGWNRLRAGDTDDPALLEPIYAHGRRAQEALPA